MGIGSKYGITAETGNNIQTEGLVFYIDSSIKKSYPRTGTNVFNLASGSLTPPTGSLINDVGVGKELILPLVLFLMVPMII